MDSCLIVASKVIIIMTTSNTASLTAMEPMKNPVTHARTSKRTGIHLMKWLPVSHKPLTALESLQATDMILNKNGAHFPKWRNCYCG